MRLVLTSIIGAAVLCIAPAAFAQFPVGGAPTLRVVQIPTTMNTINQKNWSDDVLFHIQWSATVPFTEQYQYELTYDRTRSMTIPDLCPSSQACAAPVMLSNDINNNMGMNPGNICALGACQGARPSPSINDFTINARRVVQSMTSTITTRTISIRVYRASDPLNMSTQATGGWTFTIQLVPPVAPTIVSFDAGDQRIGVNWEINNPSTISSFDVLYCPDIHLALTGTAATSTVFKARPRFCHTTTVSGLGGSQTHEDIHDGLVDGVPAAFSVRATDSGGNVGVTSPWFVATPIPTYDFWHTYKANGGNENGGFCFVATAAYGSYAHPVVWVLRAFRDRVLKATPLGTALVWSYYRLSPPLADEIRSDPVLRSWVRALLIPIAALAGLVTLLPFGGLAVLIVFALRRFRWVRVAMVGAPWLLVVLFAREVSAQELIRQKPANANFGIGVELKGGPYLPDMGQDTGGKEGNTAFAQLFGSNPKPLFSLGGDLQLYRDVGTAGVGLSFGFIQYLGKAFKVLPPPGSTAPRSGDTNVFNTVPLELGPFYRFDYFADSTGFPLVPYARVGLAYYIWWSTNGVGDVSRYSPNPGTVASDSVARGGKFGYFGTVGVSILLNALEPISAHRLYELTSIRGTYLFGELKLSKVDGFGGSGFDLSDRTWNLGVYLEI